MLWSNANPLQRTEIIMPRTQEPAELHRSLPGQISPHWAACRVLLWGRGRDCQHMALWCWPQGGGRAPWGKKKKRTSSECSELFYTSITESAQGKNEPVSEKDRSSVSRRCRNTPIKGEGIRIRLKAGVCLWSLDFLRGQLPLERKAVRSDRHTASWISFFKVYLI